MRVLHLCRDFPPHSAGGSSTAVGTLSAALNAHGCTSHVVSFDFWRARSGSEVSVTTDDNPQVALRIAGGFPFEAVSEAARVASPALVQLHHENLWPFAERIRQELGTPIVYTVHTLQRRDPAEGFHSSRDQRTALASSELVTAPSRFAAREVEPLASTVEIAPNIVPSPAPAARRQTTHPIVAYVGRFDRAKGTDTLFDVMEHVLDRADDVHFEIAGGLPASGKRERRWLRRWHERAPAGAADRARFRGWLGRDELQRLYARSSVQIVPSRCETFGLSAAEAMASAVPVVATRCPALTELIEDGRTGILCDQEDTEGIASAVLRLIRAPAEAEALARHAADSIERRFSAAAALPQWLGAYERALATTARAAGRAPTPDLPETG